MRQNVPFGAAPKVTGAACHNVPNGRTARVLFNPPASLNVMLKW
jgi:hypothetical protein